MFVGTLIWSNNVKPLAGARRREKKLYILN